LHRCRERYSFGRARRCLQPQLEFVHLFDEQSSRSLACDSRGALISDRLLQLRHSGGRPGHRTSVVLLTLNQSASIVTRWSERVANFPDVGVRVGRTNGHRLERAVNGLRKDDQNRYRGAGIWGANHALALRDYARRPGPHLRSRRTRAKLAAAKFGCAWTSSLDSLASSDVEAVTIATLTICTGIRRSACCRPASMSCGKPLATSIADGKAMVAAAKQAGGKLMVDFHAAGIRCSWAPKPTPSARSGRAGDGYARLSEPYMCQPKCWLGRRSGPSGFFPHIMDVARWLISATRRGLRKGIAAFWPPGVDCGRHPSAGGIRGRRVVHFRDLLDLPNSYTNVVDNRLTLYGEKAAWNCATSRICGFSPTVPHAVFLGIGDALRQSLGFQYESIRYFIDCVADNVAPNRREKTVLCDSDDERHSPRSRGARRCESKSC